MEPMSFSEAANSWWFWGLVVGGLALVYFLPTIIAILRQVEHLPLIITLNMFPIARPGALTGAFMLPHKQPTIPYYAYYTPLAYYQP
jgi:hypothetical protein